MDSVELTQDQIQEQEKEKAKFIAELEEKAKQLSAANNGAEVIPVFYLDPIDPKNGTPIVGFLKEPNRATKAAIGDELMKSSFRGYMTALQACLMPDVSDARLKSQDSRYDAVIFAAGGEAANFVRIAISQLKKK